MISPGTRVGANRILLSTMYIDAFGEGKPTEIVLSSARGLFYSIFVSVEQQVVYVGP